MLAWFYFNFSYRLVKLIFCHDYKKKHKLLIVNFFNYCLLNKEMYDFETVILKTMRRVALITFLFLLFVWRDKMLAVIFEHSSIFVISIVKKKNMSWPRRGHFYAKKWQLNRKKAFLDEKLAAVGLELKVVKRKRQEGTNKLTIVERWAVVWKALFNYSDENHLSIHFEKKNCHFDCLRIFRLK